MTKEQFISLQTIFLRIIFGSLLISYVTSVSSDHPNIIWVPLTCEVSLCERMERLETRTTAAANALSEVPRLRTEVRNLDMLINSLEKKVNYLINSIKTKDTRKDEENLALLFQKVENQEAIIKNLTEGLEILETEFRKERTFHSSLETRTNFVEKQLNQTEELKPIVKEIQKKIVKLENSSIAAENGMKAEVFQLKIEKLENYLNNSINMERKLRDLENIVDAKTKNDSIVIAKLNDLGENINNSTQITSDTIILKHQELEKLILSIRTNSTSKDEMLEYVNISVEERAQQLNETIRKVQEYVDRKVEYLENTSKSSDVLYNRLELLQNDVNITLHNFSDVAERIKHLEQGLSETVNLTKDYFPKKIRNIEYTMYEINDSYTENDISVRDYVNNLTSHNALQMEKAEKKCNDSLLLMSEKMKKTLDSNLSGTQDSISELKLNILRKLEDLEYLFNSTTEMSLKNTEYIKTVEENISSITNFSKGMFYMNTKQHEGINATMQSLKEEYVLLKEFQTVLEYNLSTISELNNFLQQNVERVILNITDVTKNLQEQFSFLESNFNVKINKTVNSINFISPKIDYFEKVLSPGSDSSIIERLKKVEEKLYSIVNEVNGSIPQKLLEIVKTQNEIMTNLTEITVILYSETRGSPNYSRSRILTTESQKSDISCLMPTPQDKTVLMYYKGRVMDQEKPKLSEVPSGEELWFQCEHIGTFNLKGPSNTRCENGSWSKAPPRCEKLEITHQSSRTEEIVCPKAYGVFPYPKDCSKFINCWKHRPTIQDCPPTLHFRAAINSCDWKKQANCHPRNINSSKKKLPSPIILIEPDPYQPDHRLGVSYTGQLVVYPGTSFKLTCLYSEDAGDLKWTYQNDDLGVQPLYSTRKKTNSSSIENKLMINNASEKHSGSYKCTTLEGIQKVIEVTVQDDATSNPQMALTIPKDQCSRPDISHRQGLLLNPDKQRYRYAEKVTFHCKAPLKIKFGSAIMTCMDAGSWSTKNFPQCER
ncbi:uncharacterized protein LOC106461128 isoform X2 [Limulus polyphemus]|uniref:Uncharacterized protein LOC106461128 isoform X2 n=1 Tax=Limulus polyphemus TaxID=6850 RepID=A0ABM1SK22_LIMPO|nr:uncharacterized protein LOC106461128 isoform X2 [Limulus polyphemus]